MKTANNNTYSETYYHFVWATKGRVGYIGIDIEAELYLYIRSKCNSIGVVVHAIGGTVDHVHLACTLPNTLCIADFMHNVKGSSSHFVSHRSVRLKPFAWQEGYGVLTFARRQLTRVVSYVNGQKQHHELRSTTKRLEMTHQLSSDGFLPG